MKFIFKIQQHQTDAVECIARMSGIASCRQLHPVEKAKIECAKKLLNKASNSAFVMRMWQVIRICLMS